MKATEVFRPGSFPTHTYVTRAGTELEQSLRDALDTPGQIVSIVGPSKSGKTVLVERVVGANSVITVTGAGISSPEDVWHRTLDCMGEPDAISKMSTTGGKGKMGVGLAGGEVSHQRAVQKTHQRRGLQQVMSEISKSEFVLLIDDFHYMPRDIQAETSKQLKEAARLGVKICTAQVKHRADDLVRANPELRGRVRALDIDYWSPHDLEKIAKLGFRELRVEVDPAVVKRLAEESAGSPQLMQLLCLQACVVGRARTKSRRAQSLQFDDQQLREVFKQASATTDCRSLVDVLDAGPMTRGRQRKTFCFSDGSAGDVYRCVLKAIALDPPQLAFKYDALLSRCHLATEGDAPTGSNVQGTCSRMAFLAEEKFPKERALDWDPTKNILDVPDPYLLFYLRWSGRLNEPD